MKISVIHTQVRKYTRKIRETAVETQQSFACFFICLHDRENQKLEKNLEHLGGPNLETQSASSNSGSFSLVVNLLD